MARHAGECRIDHHLGLMLAFTHSRVVEYGHVGLRDADSCFEYIPKFPLRIGCRQLGVRVDLLRQFPVAGLDQHVSHVEKETLEVMRRDP